MFRSCTCLDNKKATDALTFPFDEGGYYHYLLKDGKMRPKNESARKKDHVGPVGSIQFKEKM